MVCLKSHRLRYEGLTLAVPLPWLYTARTELLSVGMDDKLSVAGVIVCKPHFLAKLHRLAHRLLVGGGEYRDLWFGNA